MRKYLIVLFFLSIPTAAQTARVGFEESIAVYGPEIFPALTLVRLCGDFRLLVAYVNGTDLLFVDKLIPAAGGSTYRVEKSFGFGEFNHYEASRDISAVTCEKRDSGFLEIMGSGTDGHSNREFDFKVLLDTQTGAYQYTDTLD